MTLRLATGNHTCSYKSLRGYTCVGAAVDEVAFWSSEDSLNPDREVLIALRASMASVPAAMLIGLTTTYARRGEVWRVFDTYFAKNDASDVLVVNGPTRAFNPTIRQSLIDAAYEEDPIAVAAEYGGEFRRDIESYLSRESLDAVVVQGRPEQPPASGESYVAFVDPAGGSGADAMTLAIAHRQGERAVLDVVREVRPPFSPEATVQEFTEILHAYRITRVVGDRYAGTWPAEQFQKRGITYVPSERTKAEVYQAFAPLINSARRVELLDSPRLKKQLLGLERRTSRTGRDVVDHRSGQSDDLANSVAGAIVLAAQKPLAPTLREALYAARWNATELGRSWSDSPGRNDWRF